MTSAELRAILLEATAKCGPLPWTASDPNNVSQVAVAAVFNALPALLDVAEAAKSIARIADGFDKKRGLSPSKDDDPIMSWCVPDVNGKAIELTLTVGMLRRLRVALAKLETP